MKGIILAGGKGTRLYPITLAVSKQLMPIYDKPMIYYPLTTLMKAGVRDILIITTPFDIDRFKHLLGDGSQLGCSFTYKIQDEPRGLADAFIVGEEFIGDDSVMLVLGDNLFYGSDIDTVLQETREQAKSFSGGLIFGAWVADPARYGIVEFDISGKVISVEEKPETPKSQYAIPGLYAFDNRAIQFAKEATPSARGEIEITEVMQRYLDQEELRVKVMGRGSAWLDTGTFDSMNEAATFVEVLEKRQGFKIGCIEEEAYRQGFIDAAQVKELAEPLMKSGYGEYLLSVVGS